MRVVTSSTYDAGDPDQVATRKRGAKLDRETELVELKAALAVPGVSKFLWRALVQAKPYETSFSSDALVMARNEGRRELGLWLIAEIAEADPDAYWKMQRDAAARAKEKAE